MVQFLRIAALALAAAALSPTTADAQSYGDLQRAAVPQSVDLSPDVVDPYAAAGPTIYICDAAGQLSTITLGNYAVHHLGYGGAVLTDIAFNPKDGQLYGISFNAFYRVNRANGRTTFIGSLGISDANSLVFDANGKAYTEGVTFAELYTINIQTGRVSAIGATAPFRSAGDLTFYNGGLVLVGYYQSSLGDTTPDTLVQLNPKTGKPLAYAELKLANLFGVVSTGKNLLFGFAGTSLYELFPSQANINKRAVLLKSFAGKGIRQIYGAAYDGYFQK